MIVIITEHFVNKTVTDCFAHGIKAEKVNIKDYQKEYPLMIKLLDTVNFVGMKNIDENFLN